MKEDERRQRSNQPTKEDLKIKIHKDLSFLMDIRPTFINNCTAKYIIQEGQGQIIADLVKQFAFDIFYSYYQYDYEGKLLQKMLGPVKLTINDKNEKLKTQIYTMRLKEKAWFNICDQLIHLDTQVIEQVDFGTITQDANLDQDIKTVPYQQRTGTHYEIVVDKFQYRNAQTIEVKRRVNQQYREKGRQLFGLKKYYQAIKLYKYLINITQSISRKRYEPLPEQIAQLESMNNSAKINFLRCFFKLEESKLIEEQAEFKQTVKTVLQYLLRVKPNDHQVHFFNAKWLLKQKYLDNALESAIKSNKIKYNESAIVLIQQIKKAKENKGKIKQAVISQPK